MAKSYELEIEGHPSIYEPRERKLKIYFSEPEKGINKETGLVLFLSGFGGNANSNVYKKMRNLFADEYNLLTVQCDYFGWEFMQSKTEGLSLICDFNQFKDYPPEAQREAIKNQNNFAELMELAERNNRKFRLNVDQQENWHNFNDMGMMQAIDNITAVLTVIKIVEDNGYPFNSKRVILYGHSQGAYLAHLCNVFAPTLFSLMIDNSAWLCPKYLNEERKLTLENGIELIYSYLIRDLQFDKEIYNLAKIYKDFQNNCAIIAFHGIEDSLVDYYINYDTGRPQLTCIFTQ